MKAVVWVLSITFVMLCWVNGFAQKTGVENDYQMEFKFNKGDAYTLVNKVTLKLDAEISDEIRELLEMALSGQLGLEEELSFENPLFDVTIESEISWDVESVEDEVATIKQKATDIKIKGKALGQDINVENIEDLEEYPLAENILQGFLQEQELRIDKYGAVESDGQRNPFGGIFSGMGALPKKEVKVGDTWTDEKEEDAIGILPGKYKVKITSKLVKVEQRGDEQIATIATEGEISISLSGEEAEAPMMGVMSGELNGKSKGSYTFNITKGIQESSNGQTTLEVSLSGEDPTTGAQLDLKAEIKIDVKTEVKPGAPSEEEEPKEEPM